MLISTVVPASACRVPFETLNRPVFAISMTPEAAVDKVPDKFTFCNAVIPEALKVPFDNMFPDVVILPFDPSIVIFGATAAPKSPPI